MGMLTSLLDIIRGIDAIRTGAHVLFAGTLQKWMFLCSDAINRNRQFKIELYP